jgi:prevent-host-death family protein
MIKANVSDVKARLSHFLRLAKDGEDVVICARNEPIARLIPIPPKIDLQLRESAFGRYNGCMTEEEVQEALRPMTDEEADAFVEGKY